MDEADEVETRERGRRGETEGVDETQVKKTKMKKTRKNINTLGV